MAECREGLGSKLFEEYINNFSSFQEIIEHFEKIEFKVGPHKTYQLALQAMRNRLILVSSLDDSTINKTFLESAKSVKGAMNLVSEINKPNFSIAVVPFATNTVLY